MPSAELIELLHHGEITVKGRMPWSSNATFLTEVCARDTITLAVYKPSRGERQLWDFPSGLGKREVAAYELSEAMGLGLVPVTVLRHDAPLGEGSLQWFVEADFKEHYFSLHEQRPELHDRFRAFAVFDYVANNTDRKSGHCLIDAAGQVWGIDNGFQPDHHRIDHWRGGP